MFIHTYEMPTDVLKLDDEEVWHVAAFKIKDTDRSEMTRWCYKTYGPPGWQSNIYQTRWKDSIHWGEIYFKKKQDLEWFVLRYS